ncbi:hypothetical protein V6N11_010858 [Hibiscus sabdariffa]|uniref:Phosphatidic acid phosphatase type 2/haloperoxidase domain-containing protein n=1 Tax=Hibiscus sabdariffa TaxID=183260 RepID=A0ABR2S6H3_9ROSI
MRGKGKDTKMVEEKEAMGEGTVGREGDREGGGVETIPLILGHLLDLVLIGLIKLTFRRARPHYNPNMSAVVHADNFSFPSGHASRVLFLATLFHLIFQHNKELVSDFIRRWIKFEPGFVVLGVWVWAIMTATSRVLLGRHFFFDVLAGAFVGVLEGIVAYRFLRF